MTTLPSPTDTSHLDLKIECHHCGRRYRVRHPQQLTHGARSTCPACQTPFAVIVRPVMKTTDAPARQSRSGETAALFQGSFHGRGNTLLGMQIVTFCLTLLTMGLYHFWGKARIRRYLFSQTAFGGDRFAYHGTGRELCLGFLTACLIFGLPYGLLVAVQSFLDLVVWVEILLQGLAGLMLFTYVPTAMVNARRYRCNRTSWRGIRFSFRGRTWDFMKLYGTGWCLTLLTLGTYYPYFQTERQAFLSSNTTFGNRRFGFGGHGSGLIGPFALALVTTYLLFALCGLALLLDIRNAALALLLIPLIVVPLWIRFLAKQYQYFWNHTTFGQARFSSSITWQGLVMLYFGNLALLIVTLGVAWPWTTVRSARFHAASLSLHGPVALEQVLQPDKTTAPTGEGLANFLENGFELS